MSGTSETVVSSANAMVACAMPSFAPLRQSTSAPASTSTPKRRSMNRRPLAEALGAAKRRIAVVSRIAKCGRDGVDDRRRSRLVRIAHAEVDEIGAATLGRRP